MYTFLLSLNQKHKFASYTIVDVAAETSLHFNQEVIWNGQ